MKIRLLLAGLLIAASATTAMAAGPYVTASGGISIIHDGDVTVSGVGTVTSSYDTGFGINVGGGYNFDGFRVEGEFGYKNADFDKFSGPGGSAILPDSDVTVMSYMGNGYFDFKNNSPITPFIGAGIGLLNGEFNAQGDKKDDTVFGYQLMAGASYSVNKNINIDLSYRFQGAGSDFEMNGVSFEYNNSSFLGGVRYNF